MRARDDRYEFEPRRLLKAGVRGGLQTYHMLGLGDMAIPGIFLALALAFDKHLADEHARKDGSDTAAVAPAAGDGSGSGSASLEPSGARERHASEASASASAAAASVDAANEADATSAVPPVSRRQYFFAARRGYVAGIALSIGASRLTGAAQPALLYLVPCVLLPIVIRAKARNHLGLLWAGFSNDDDGDGDVHDNVVVDVGLRGSSIDEEAQSGLSGSSKGSGVECTEEDRHDGTSERG